MNHRLAARELLEASRRLREALETAEAIYAKSADVLTCGTGAAEMVRANGGPLSRCEVTAHMEEFARARANVRRMILLQCLDEGMTFTEYAELIGVSRQQAQRMARKAPVGQDVCRA